MSTHSPVEQHSHSIHATASRYGMGLKTPKSYITGLVLCLILTGLAFGLVEFRLLSDAGLYISIAVLAIVQLFVQIVCFLRLNTTKTGMWNSMSFLFALVIVLILVIGTLWIMFNLEYFMAH
jgi:cytochrome o ubiquinol oxidase operon protein cyoD